MASCQTESTTTTKKGQDSVAIMADLHCEAVELRKVRFELADEIRFAEDTLLHLNPNDTDRVRLEHKLQALGPYTDSIVTRSLELSKIINSTLDSLMEKEFIDRVQREAFDSSLTAELSKRGCQ